RETREIRRRYRNQREAETMITILLKIFIVALSLLFVAEIVPGILVADFYVAVIAAIVLGILNLTVKPILFILTLPITILTLGLFTFIINATIFLLAASFLQGFEVQGFIPALFGSFIVSLIGTLTNRLFD